MKITIKCEKEIATDSLDHIYPFGTANCNQRNLRFINKFDKLLRNNSKQLNVLDLGCAGGGFVRDCNNVGMLAVGVEGSDFSKNLKRQNWAIIPEFLFNCDITKKFELFSDGKKIKFNLITAWEVLEHIKKKDIENLIENIKSNLDGNGIFVGSVSSYPVLLDGVDLHETQESFNWWKKQFEKKGFYVRWELYDYFNGQYVNDFKGENKMFFHLILSLKNKKFNYPKLSLRDKFLDKWINSFMQKRIKYLVTGGNLQES